MAKFSGSVKAITRKNDGIKGSDDQWYNAPYGGMLPPSVVRGVNLEFSYEVQSGPKGSRRIIDLPTIKVGTSSTGSSTGSVGRVSDKDRQTSIVRQSSLAQATAYAVAQVNKGVDVDPASILKLAGYYASWVEGDLTVDPVSVFNSSPESDKGVDGVDASSIPPFDV